jgi:hypothetical protein
MRRRQSHAGLAGARGFDGGVQRQQVGLSGDGIDQFDHVADAACRLRQLTHAAIGLPGLVNSSLATRDDS